MPPPPSKSEERKEKAATGPLFLPEPLTFDTVSLAGTHLRGHSFNPFFPWQVNEDGGVLETVNHVGRHELGGSFVDAAFTDVPALTYLTDSLNQNKIAKFFQIKQLARLLGWWLINRLGFGKKTTSRFLEQG